MSIALRSRKLADGQTHWSIAMDATDVSFAKYMTATIDFPALEQSFWAPPMDSPMIVM